MSHHHWHGGGALPQIAGTTLRGTAIAQEPIPTLMKQVFALRWDRCVRSGY
jgi:hypothetical protein